MKQNQREITIHKSKVRYNKELKRNLETMMKPFTDGHQSVVVHDFDHYNLGLARLMLLFLV